MSLKAFHIFFIALSILMCVGIGVARIQAYSAGAGLAAAMQAGASFAGAGGLLVYAARFVKKTRGIGYL